MKGHAMKYRFPAFLLALAFLSLQPIRQLHAASAQGPGGSALKVLAVETFLADMAQNVAGNRLKVVTLLPIGADPHSFDPTPADVVKAADCNILFVNGAGFEGFLDKLLQNVGGVHRVIVASEGLTVRTKSEDEAAEADEDHDRHESDHPHHAHHAQETDHHHGSDSGHEADHAHHDQHHHHHDGDPHFWLAPPNVIRYVENIRDGLIQADPDGKTSYAANADAYIAQIVELDRWIEDQVKQIPVKRRLLVTNHESLGYFADLYGFEIIGAVIPSVSTDASPSARELAHLVERIKATGTRAIFMETGANPQLSKQVAKETGVEVVAELHIHSITEPGGPAPTYIEMMKYNVTTIVDALK
jgi:ABC-type Zn uptake system ZnuABC Zn-binding protein ZnuA